MLCTVIANALWDRYLALRTITDHESFFCATASGLHK